MPASKINDVGLAYQISGEGSPVVPVHGGWGDHEVWGQLVPLLARHRQVITYDRRGYGASERPLGPRRIRDDDVEDLAALEGGEAALGGAVCADEGPLPRKVTSAAGNTCQ